MRGLTRRRNNDSREHGKPADAFQATDKNSVLGDSAAARLTRRHTEREQEIALSESACDACVTCDRYFLHSGSSSLMSNSFQPWYALRRLTSSWVKPSCRSACGRDTKRRSRLPFQRRSSHRNRTSVSLAQSNAVTVVLMN